MKNIEYFLNLDYSELRNYLLNAPTDEKKEILSNIEIKKKLICPENRHDFSYLAQEKSKDIIPYLLDGEGIEILKTSEFFTDKMNAILTSCSPYVDTILGFEKFRKLIFDNFDNLGYYLYAINPVGGEYLVIEAQKENLDLVNIISKFPDSTQIELLKKHEFSNDDYWRMVSNSKNEAASILLQEKSVGKSLVDIKLSIIESIAQKSLALPQQILEEKDFVERISTIMDMKTYRFLINDLEKSNDVEKIEIARKKHYDYLLKSFNKESGMLKIYEDLYEMISQMEHISIFSLSEENRRQLENNNMINEAFDIFSEINKLEREKGLDGVVEYLKEKSNAMLSNIIIDYHFEDYYLNVLKDVKQLCNFDMLGGNALSSEKMEIYRKILEIETLSYEEKLQLHEELGRKDYVESFYDDVRSSRDKMYSLMQEAILNKDKISKYKDEEASSKTGVNIYRLEGEPFYALVKSMGVDKSLELYQGDIYSTKDGGCFSIDAFNKLQTYKDPKCDYNLIFDGFNVDQVVHMFPVDSFSGYVRGGQGTDRIIELLPPEEFTGRSRYYNEVIIAQKNIKRPTDMDERLPLPKPFAIYCYDEIGPNDIESAKKLGIGIVVVNTKKYDVKSNDSQISMWNTMSSGNDSLDFKYATNKYEAGKMEEAEARKR